MRLLVTRPAKDAAALMASLRARGHEPIAAPVMEIAAVAGASIDLAGIQAVLATSRNGVEALARHSSERAIPLLAVGARTAAAAKAEGFSDVVAAAGDVEALAGLAAERLRPERGPLLQVAGTVSAGDLAGLLASAGFRVRRAVLYEARPVAALAPAACEALAQGRVGGALFYSPRTVKLFGALLGAASLGAALGGVTAYCLSPAVAAEAAALSFRAVRTADAPREDALLALIEA